MRRRIATKKLAAASGLVVGAAALVVIGLMAEALIFLPAAIAMAALAFLTLHRRAVLPGLCIIAVLAAATAAELALRVGDRQDVAAALVSSGSYTAADYHRHTAFGPAAKSGVHTSRKTTRAGELIYDVAYTIDANGFRVTPAAAAAAGKRINFLGCSQTFGEGVGDDRTLPYFTAKLGGFSVRNLAFHGWSPSNALAILESGHDTSGNVNFLRTFAEHASRVACEPYWSAHSPRYRIGDGKLVRDGMCRDERHERPGRLRAVLGQSRVFGIVSELVGGGARQDRQIELYLAVIGEMHALSARRGQRFVAGYIRMRKDWFKGRYSDESILQRLRAMQILVIEMSLASPDGSVDPRYTLHALDGHASPVANEARATLLIQALSPDVPTGR